MIDYVVLQLLYWICVLKSYDGSKYILVEDWNSSHYSPYYQSWFSPPT